MSRSFSRPSSRGFSLRLASVAFCVASLVSILAVPSSARAQGLFQSLTPTLTTGTTPQGAAAADFNRSGFQGLVVTDSASKNMKVYFGTGVTPSGIPTFGGANTYPTCTGPTAVLAKDLNSDGYPDIVVACTISNTLEVFVNNGAGGFGSPLVTETVTDPVAIVTGYFNDSGIQGVAVLSGTGGVTIYLDIAGSIVTKTVPLTGALTGLVTGDFNNDGNLDLAVSDNTNNNVHILTNDGTGTFTVLGGYSVGTGTKPSGIVAADFNHDGHLDVATSNAGTNTSTILLGSATGALTVQPAQATGTNPIAIAVTDVNSDGYPDVVAFDSPTATTGEVDVLLGSGNGMLQTAQVTSQSFKPGTLAAVADFNRDGKPDLALTQQNNNRASVLLNNTLQTAYPDGRSFSAANQLSVGYGNFADSVTVGDFNKDGNLDIAVSYLEDNTVGVLLNNGTSFGAASIYPVGQQPYFVTSGDLNGDGYSDMVVVNSTVNGPQGTIGVLLNNRNGTFAPAVSYTVGRLPYQVAIGDINGDGYPDLAATNYGANTVSILYGSKSGTFTTGPTLATGANPYGVVIGDFQHNGHPDIAITCYTPDMLYVFPNNGDGTFGSPFMTSTGAGPMSLVTGDFNRDGKLDIVVANATGISPTGPTAPIPDPTTSGNNISFFAGNGNGTFQSSVISPSLNFPQSIAAGDVNGDGILDIVGVAPNYNAVMLTLGVGDGTFGTFQQRAAGQFSAAKQPWGVALGDFNNDGQLDIVTANTFNQVNITIPAYQNRYMTQYPAIPGGNPSIDILTNASAAQIGLSVAPPNNTFPLPDNNSDVTIQATVQPAYSGGTPTGSVIFENSAGAVQGTGPYTLNSGGVASYDVGHLGSGSYLFTSLYSGDANFQPTTASGAAFAVTVAGTPVTLTLSTSSVSYGGTFTATAIVTGTAALGHPTGTLAIYSSTGFELGTITLANSGNNTTGTSTFTAVAPNLNVGSYNFYAVYTPTNGNYQAGSSSYAPLTVTTEGTTTSINCNIALFSTTCTATVTAANGGFPPNGDTVTFTATGEGPSVYTITNGKTGNYNFTNILGAFTITATFPAQGNYATSNDSTQGVCFILTCVANAARTGAFTTLDSFTGSGFTGTGFGNFSTPAGRTNNPNSRSNNRNTPFTLF